MKSLPSSLTGVLLFCALSLFAQTPADKDKFKREINQLYDMMDKGEDYTPSLKITKNGMHWTKQAKLDSMYWSFYVMHATTYKVMNKFDTALLLFKKADSVAGKRGYTRLQIGIQLSIIRTLEVFNDSLNERPKWIAKLKPLVESFNDPRYLADWEGEMASWKRNQYAYEEAMKHHLKQISYLNDSTYTSRRAFATASLGVLLSDMSNHSAAIAYIKKAIALHLKTNSEYYTSIAYSNIGNSFLALYQPDSAQQYFSKGLAVAKKYNHELAMITCYLGLAQIAISQENYSATEAQQTEAMLHAALKISDELDLTERRANVNFFLGESALRTGNHSNAERFLTTSFQLAKQVNSKLVMSNALALLGKVYTERRQYPKAIDALNQAMTYKDSIYEDNILRRTEELEARFQNERKEAEINKLNDEQKMLHLAHQKEQTVIVSIFAFIVMLAATGWSFYYYRNKRKMQQKENELLQLHHRVAETRQIAMRAQMNPHFIFNCMAAADHYILNNERTVASELLTSFADLVRRVLEHSELEMISIHEEFTSLELYLKVECLRFHNAFTYEITIDESIDFEVPPLLLQPYVENAILHGITHLKGHGKIEITATLVSDSNVTIIIRDNGIGINQSSALNKQHKPTHQSMGTRITKERMELLRILHDIEVDVIITDRSERDHTLTGTEIFISLERSSVLSSLQAVK